MNLLKHLPGLLAAWVYCAVSPAMASSMFQSPSFTVTQSGAAAMGVSFQVAPGIAGMQPTIGLSYNSQGANGLVGVGWHIDGMSSISRCRANLSEDGFRDMATVPQSDSRFCLDGQRLVLVSGTYGDANSEYRLEIDDKTKVIAYGSVNGKGPQYFKAWRKNGEVVEYGNTSDSRVHSSDPNVSGSSSISWLAVPIIWQQNRVQDRSTNYVDWSYSIDYTRGEWRPSEIRYTGNLNAGQSPLNKVVFSYGTRADAVRQYHNGYLIQVANRLTQVQMYQGGTAFLSYSLTYGSGQESKLVSVQGCSVGGTVQCWPAAQFDWGGSTSFGSASVTPSMDIGYTDGAQWADVNGDGIADYCRIVGNPGTYQVWCTLGTATGLSSTTIQSGTLDPGATYGRAFVDFDGDGKADFCRIINSAPNQQLACTLSTGTGFATGTTILSAVTPVASDGAWVDFDGDGRADYCRTTGSDAGNDGKVVCTLSAGTSFGSTLTSSVMLIGDGMRQYVDVNGDGFADFCRVKVTNATNPYQLMCTLSNGSVFSTNTSSIVYSTTEWGQDAGRQWADVNGDGLPDFCRVVTVNSTQARVKCTLADGAGGFLEEVVSDVLDPGHELGRAWVDMNGDGLADFCRATTGSTVYGNVMCTLSLGGSFGSTVTSPTMDIGYASSRRVWRDVAGGGGSGYCSTVGSGDQISCTPITTGDRRIVAMRTPGISAPSHSITYASLTSGVHTRGSSAAYPQIDAQIPLQVVSQVQVSDGGGGVRTSTYTYGGLRLEVNTGRATLGMQWQRSLDSDTNVQTETQFLQTYPFVGMPSSVTRKLNGNILSQTDSTYSFRSFTGSAQDSTASVGVGKYYQLIADRKLERNWEIGGAFINGTSTRQQNVDNYGNVGTVLAESTDSAGNASGWSRTTTTTFSNDSTNWVLGRVTRTVVAAVAPNAMASTGVGSDPQAATINGTPFAVPFRGRPAEVAGFMSTVLLPLLLD